MELLKFEAPWCSPCKQQDDILEEFDAVPITHIDVDEDHETANEYSVRGIPTMILLDDGEPVERWDGVTQLNEIESAVEAVK
jgi:thioredoxin 1